MFYIELHLVWSPDASVYILKHECGDAFVISQARYLF